jgi:hypothetical protein
MCVITLKCSLGIKITLVEMEVFTSMCLSHAMNIFLREGGVWSESGRKQQNDLMM